jgi:hypothetical protein
MIRGVIVAAAILGLVVAAREEGSPADARPGIDSAVWRAAGIVAFSRSLPAPPLRLSDLSGKTVDLPHFQGRLVMLYFWATW